MNEVPVYTINPQPQTWARQTIKTYVAGISAVRAAIDPEPQTWARQAIETYVAADSAVRAAMLEAIAAIQEDEPMQAIIFLPLSLPIALSLALSLSLPITRST